MLFTAVEHPELEHPKLKGSLRSRNLTGVKPANQKADDR